MIDAPAEADKIIERLKGTNIFLKGSHDNWLKDTPYLIEKKVEGQFIVMCHYAMRDLAKSHHGSWQLNGHSHACLPPEGKQWDVGVDNNNFVPVSFAQIVKIMSTLPDNFNLVKDRK